MSARLEIVWDGDVKGLDERRLSLDAFGPALQELLAAIRRIASDIELEATTPGRAKGRLAREAANLDVQLVRVQANSPMSVFAEVVPLSAPARPLIADLSERALDRFLEDVERESSGRPAHYRVRKYLSALPEGLNKQTYIHRGPDGNVVRQVEVGAMALPDAPTAPFLIELRGVIVGVGFEPGRPEVKIRTTVGDQLTLSATPEQVEGAIALRTTEIEALAVAESSRTRLLRIGREFHDRGPEARTDYLFEHWPAVLHRLAQ